MSRFVVTLVLRVVASLFVYTRHDLMLVFDIGVRIATGFKGVYFFFLSCTCQHQTAAVSYVLSACLLQVCAEVNFVCALGQSIDLKY